MEQKSEKKNGPFSWLGKLFFQQIDPLVRLGSRKSLQAEDMPALPIELGPRDIPVDESKIDWSTGPKLIFSIFRSSSHIWSWSLLLIGLTAGFNLATPVLVHAFVGALERGARDPWIWGLGACVGALGMASGLCIQHYFHRSLRFYQVQTNVLNKKLFAHSLALSKEAREQVPIGDIVNHMSSDSDNIANLMAVMSDLFYNTIVLSGVAVMMAIYLGWTSVAAWTLLLCLVPLTKKIGSTFSHMEEVLMKERDERVTLMSQILNAIRVVKFFVWEKSVTEEVHVVRERELKARRKLAGAELLATLSYVAVSTIVLFVVLLIHSLRGFELTASLVFTCVSLFNLLEDPFAALSRQVSAVMSAFVGARRIAAFVARETRAPFEPRRALPGQALIETRDWNVIYHGSSAPALRNINFRVQRGEKIALVGSVGCGKSTLLLGLLGELQTQNGASHVRVESRAFVSQEAYLVNGSLRENLLLGREANDERVQLALQRSCLDEDIRYWDAGVMTEIGEKGVNLSGGQKQRLSLARADLQEAELLLLDDPLSAVDARTEERLMQQLVLGAWRDRTCVMATHRLEHLNRFDRVVYLRHGQVHAEGAHATLMQEVPEYREFLHEHEQTQNAEFGKVEKTELAANDAGGSTLKITQEEDRQHGAVRGSVYGDYLRSLGGNNPKLRPLMWTGLAIAACSSTALPLLQKTWLGFISNVQQGSKPLPEFFTHMGWEALVLVPWKAIVVYGAMGILTLAGILCADLFWLKRGLDAGRNMHDAMLKSVLGAPIRFFDSTPVGRVLQRFSWDLEAIDIQLQWTFEHSMKCLAQVVLTLLLIFSILPIVLVAVVPVLAVYWRYQKLYRQAAREAKRLDSVSRSPRYAHFKETLQGLVVIRAFDRSAWFMDEFYARLQKSQRMFHGHYMINRWFSSRIPMVGGFLSVVTGLAIVASVRSGQLSPGIAGLLTVYSMSFWGVMNWGIRLWADVEARMTSVERVRFMSELPQEQSVTRPADVDLLRWPSKGTIEFRDVRVRYAPELPRVLKGVNFKIEGGSRAGLIGRTGSGKSTIFQALYRFIELEEGEILIDGVSLASVPLDQLRRALAVIPQDPTLFLGTLRSNLDRFGQFSDVQINAVLERVQLKVWVDSLPLGLRTPVLENGHNLSQGQRQLLCLARALLLQAKILIMDEATASVDVQTDALIQRLVREEGRGMTILMIAHRLGTVRDCDQVIELADGQVRRVLHPRAQAHAPKMTSSQPHPFLVN